MRRSPRIAQVGIVLVVGVALAIAVLRGPIGLAEFLAAVLVDFVVSLDDVLVFPLVGTMFGLAAEARRRVVMLSLAVSLVMRVVLLLGGCSLVPRFVGIGIALGAVLLVSAFRVANGGDDDEESSWGIPMVPWALFSWVLPRTTEHERLCLTVNRNGVRYATPILTTLVAIAFWHPMVLASEAVPAVLAVTTDPVVAIASTIVVVGALFVLALGQDSEFMGRFWRPRHLQAAIVVLLFTLSAKLVWLMQLSPWLVLGVVVSVLGAVTIEHIHGSSDATSTTP